MDRPLIQEVNEEELKAVVGVLIDRDGEMRVIKDAVGCNIQTPGKFYIGLGAIYIRVFLEVPTKQKEKE